MEPGPAPSAPDPGSLKAQLPFLIIYLILVGGVLLPDAVSGDTRSLGLDANLITILFYLLLGPLMGAMAMTLPRTWERVGAGFGVLVFFWGCAASHADMYGHVVNNTVIDAADWHHYLPLVAQAVGAPLFTFIFARYATRFFAAWRRVMNSAGP